MTQLFPEGTTLVVIQVRRHQGKERLGSQYDRACAWGATRPGRALGGEARLPYTHLTVPVDSHSKPLFERLHVEVTIDHDLIAAVHARSSMSKQNRHAHIHDLEFGLSMHGVANSAVPANAIQGS